MKSYLFAFLLSVLLGPIGMFYCGIGPGVFWCLTVVLFAATLGPVGALLVWIACVALSPVHVAARRHRDRIERDERKEIVEQLTDAVNRLNPHNG